MLRIIWRQSRFGKIRVFVDAGDGGPTMRDVVGALCRDLADLVGDVVARRADAALLRDGWEVLPGRLGELLGQVLDEPRPTRRIQNPADMRLFQQQQLNVASHPTRETC